MTKFKVPVGKGVKGSLPWWQEGSDTDKNIQQKWQNWNNYMNRQGTYVNGKYVPYNSNVPSSLKMTGSDIPQNAYPVKKTKPPFTVSAPVVNNTSANNIPIIQRNTGGNTAGTAQTQQAVIPDFSNDPVKAKVFAYLQDYVNQMRAAGFSDFDIDYQLRNNRNITIPDTLPEGFGQSTWATGMLDEFMQANRENTGATTPTPGGNGYTWRDLIPGVNEYLNYMPGNTANRLPDYGEWSGQETSPYFNMSGRFSQAKGQNLRNAMQQYMENYEGPTIQPSHYAYEAGIVGLPQDMGQQFYQEFLALAQQKADDAKMADAAMADAQDQFKSYSDILLKYPEAGIQPTDTVDVIAQKIADYNRTVESQKVSTQAEQEALAKAQKFIEQYRYSEYPNEDFTVLMEAIRQGQPIDVVFNSAQYENLFMTPDLLAALYKLMGMG